MTQLSIWAELAEPVDVEPTREVRYRGAGAGPAYLTAPVIPGVSEPTARRMVSLVEEALRYDQAPNPRLDCSQRDGAGSNGPIGRDSLAASSAGIEDWETKERASWPRLLRVMRARQEAEPEIARARDLAEAIHYLDYYGRVYPDAATTERVCGPLRRAVVELGGDLELVEAAIAADER
jgi:hypothetical protein